jgi:Domain of unknown function (DUF6602)
MCEAERLANKLIEYCVSIAQEFQARINRIQVFVKHNPTSGSANEDILRDFLTKHAPGAFQVGQGFVCNPLQEDSVSRQCDILVYDQNRYPVVYEDGPVKIVWPDSVRMVIESKTQFQKRDIGAAVENIESAKEVRKIHEDRVDFNGFIFAFHSAGLETVKKYLERYLTSVPKKNRPDAILLFDKGIIIRRSPETNRYGIEATVDDQHKGAIVLTFLLLHFFDVMGSHVGVGIAEVLRQMQINYTKRVGVIEIPQPNSP